MRTTSRPTPAKGFSLIEVVIAIGIVAFVMLPVVALLGTAIDTSQQAFSRVNDTRIGAEIIGELQQADWDELDSWDGKYAYYDYQGQRMEDGTPDDAVFTAKVKVSPNSGLSLGQGRGSQNPHLRQVLVAVSSRPGEAGTAAIDEALSGSPGKYLKVHLARTILFQSDR